MNSTSPEHPSADMTPDGAPSHSAVGARSSASEVLRGLNLHGGHAVLTGGAAGLGLPTSRALAAGALPATR